MEKIALETESFLLIGEDNERFYPFLELDYNEWVIYENDQPKYYFRLDFDVNSEFEIVNWLTAEIKTGKDLQNLIMELGNKYGKEWDIFSSKKGQEREGSQRLEQIKLELLTDRLIEK